MANPHGLLQSLLPEIQRNPQLLGILAQSMGSGAQGVGGILGGQLPQALAGGPPMRQAPQPMPQAQPAPMTASAPRMGQGGPRASGWRDMARLVAAGIGDVRGGNDLAMLRDEWTKRDQGRQEQDQMAALQERIGGLDGLTQEQMMLGQVNPEALLSMLAKPKEPKERERQMVGPDLYERGDDGKWTLVIDGPDKPESVPTGMMVGPDGKLTWRPGYLEAQQGLAGATSGARREAVVSRPMPSRARAPSGGRGGGSSPSTGGGLEAEMKRRGLLK